MTNVGIDLIQFEFNEMNVVSRRFLSDFIELLGPRYELFRLLPDGGRLPLSDGACGTTNSSRSRTSWRCSGPPELRPDLYRPSPSPTAHNSSLAEDGR